MQAIAQQVSAAETGRTTAMAETQQLQEQLTASGAEAALIATSLRSAEDDAHQLRTELQEAQARDQLRLDHIGALADSRNLAEVRCAERHAAFGLCGELLDSRDAEIKELTQSAADLGLSLASAKVWLPSLCENLMMHCTSEPCILKHNCCTMIVPAHLTACSMCVAVSHTQSSQVFRCSHHLST